MKGKGDFFDKQSSRNKKTKFNARRHRQWEARLFKNKSWN